MSGSCLLRKVTARTSVPGSCTPRCCLRTLLRGWAFCLCRKSFFRRDAIARPDQVKPPSGAGSSRHVTQQTSGRSRDLFQIGGCPSVESERCCGRVRAPRYAGCSHGLCVFSDVPKARPLQVRRTASEVAPNSRGVVQYVGNEAQQRCHFRTGDRQVTGSTWLQCLARAARLALTPARPLGRVAVKIVALFMQWARVAMYESREVGV
jgi:hypothetical protein